MLTVRAFLSRLSRWRHDSLVAGCDRAAVLSHVQEAGALAPRYAFMSLLSSAIATLGLLQNSVAVIIGAMLISPLMGPIIELGMGLATFELRTVRRALGTLLAGAALALAVATTIAWLSPLKDTTPEILARTEPTLFDLLIAVFSGLAGAYATITRKGETIVGVAIATALMPPLAVVGYGLALANLHVAGGAGFLFMTNLLAIAFSATIVARVYGFRGGDSPRQSLWQASLIVATFALLSLPLGLALRKIAIRTQVEHKVRAALDEAAESAAGRVTTLHVDAGSDPLLVDAVFMTPHHVAGLDRRLEDVLRRELHRDVQLDLREVVTTSDDTDALRRSTMAELRKSVQALQSDAEARQRALEAREQAILKVHASLLARFGTLHSIDQGKAWELRIRPDAGLTLDQAYALEASARRDDPAANITVIPPAMPLLPVVFAPRGADLGADAKHALDVDAWALRRWGAVGAAVTSRSAGTSRLAGERADAVARLLEAASVKVVSRQVQAVGRRDPAVDRADIGPAAP